jgi:hypothetical protein
MFDVLSQDQLIKGLKDRQLYKVAAETNISYPTLKRLADGKEGNYTLHTLYAVSEYVRENSIDQTDAFRYNQDSDKQVKEKNTFE